MVTGIFKIDIHTYIRTYVHTGTYNICACVHMYICTYTCPMYVCKGSWEEWWVVGGGVKGNIISPVALFKMKVRVIQTYTSPSPLKPNGFGVQSDSYLRIDNSQYG